MAETPIKSLTPAMREQYDKARQAFDRGNFDYAVTLLENVLRHAPSCYPARETLRATQMRRHNSKKSFFKKMLNAASHSSSLTKARLTINSKPEQTLAECESILSENPNNIAAHKTLAQAAMACQFPKSAVLSLEVAFHHQPQDRETGLRLSEALQAAGNPLRAEEVLKGLAANLNNDPEIIQALKDASAKRSLGERGYEKLATGQGTFRDALKDQGETAELQEGEKTFQSEEAQERRIAQCVKLLQDNPDHLPTIKQLGDIYRKAGDWDNALPLFVKLTESDRGADPEIHRIVGQLQLAQLDTKIDELDPTDDEFETKRQAILQRKEDLEFENAQTLAKRFPGDHQFQLDLGKRCLARGQITEAIKLFQRTQASAHHRTQAQRYLARCFTQRGILDLAEKTLRAALAEKTVVSDEKKELLYDLGTVLEKADKDDEAIEQYKLIYEIDIDFRDVAEKVDRYYADR